MKFKVQTPKFIAAFTLLTISIFAKSLLAQQPALQPKGGATAGQTAKGAVLKGKAPVNKEPLRVKLPKAQEVTLSNGLQVVLLENHNIPTFTIQMVILSGGLSDPADHRGLSSFTASLLREGTTKRTSKDISEQIESIGTALNASSSLPSFTSSINSQGLVENFDATLDIFADVIRNPQFPADEVEKFKARTLAQMQFQRSIPQLLALERFYRSIYGTHYAGQALPTADTVKNTNSEELKKFHQTYYRPNNAVLAVAGDITMKELLPKITQAFGDWQKAQVPQTQIAKVSPVGKTEISLIDRPGSVQTVLQLGNLAIERTDKDYFALAVMNQILGGGTSARLFTNLREDKGYTYGAYSNFATSKYPGIIWASAEVRTEVTDGAMKEFLYEINRIRNERVSVTELENAKRGMTGSFAISLEQPQALLSNIVTQRTYGLPTNYWDTYPQKIAAVTVEDVQRVAQRYLDLSSLQVVAVGDAAKIHGVLTKYGVVKQYNAEGKEIAVSNQ